VLSIIVVLHLPQISVSLSPPWERSIQWTRRYADYQQAGRVTGSFIYALNQVLPSMGTTEATKTRTSDTHSETYFMKNVNCDTSEMGFLITL